MYQTFGNRRAFSTHISAHTGSCRAPVWREAKGTPFSRTVPSQELPRKALKPGVPHLQSPENVLAKEDGEHPPGVGDPV